MDREQLYLKLKATESSLSDAYYTLEELANVTFDNKLYKIADEADPHDFEEYFDSFCQDHWQQFLDYLESIEVKLSSRNNSSKFAFSTEFLDKVDCSDFKAFVETLADNYSSNPVFAHGLSNVDDGLLDLIEEALAAGRIDEHDVNEEIDELLVLIPDINATAKKLDEAADYLETFKANQMQYWVDYLEAYGDE